MCLGVDIFYPFRLRKNSFFVARKSLQLHDDRRLGKGRDAKSLGTHLHIGLRCLDACVRASAYVCTEGERCDATDNYSTQALHS